MNIILHPLFVFCKPLINTPQNLYVHAIFFWNEGVSPKKKKKRMYSAPVQWQSDGDPTYTAWMPPEGEIPCLL